MEILDELKLTYGSVRGASGDRRSYRDPEHHFFSSLLDHNLVSQPRV